MLFIKLNGVLINLALVASVSFTDDGDVGVLGVKDDGSIIIAFAGDHKISMTAGREDYDELCEEIERVIGADFDQ